MWFPNENVQQLPQPESIENSVLHCLHNITDSRSGSLTIGRVTVPDFLHTILYMCYEILM